MDGWRLARFRQRQSKRMVPNCEMLAVTCGSEIRLSLPVTETGDEDPDHDDGGPSGTEVLTVEPSFSVPGDKDCDDKVAECHDPSTSDKHGLTTQLVDVHDGRDGEEEHDNTDHTGGEEGNGVSSETEGLEDLRGVVEDSVNTSPLLEEHGKASDLVRLSKTMNGDDRVDLRNTDTLEHGLALEQRSDGLELELGDRQS